MNKQDHENKVENGKTIDERGVERWFRDGLLHRDDGPAKIFPDGSKCWYSHGKPHREDGAAFEVYRHGELIEEHYVHGKWIRPDMMKAVISLNLMIKAKPSKNKVKL
ncbi:hypothetical protein [Paraburkholderia xenovorans]|jgi:hypothetical protein|uniref:hypothetical protein n=1 Tax=Paraburkholderia xenovorans TaxID=36873 RepID=UPI00056DE4C3|nr:hypothetical protein [Paraburkholderia xenovorans]